MEITLATEQDQIREVIPVILASLTPARLAEVAVSIETLAMYYPVLKKTDAENRLWVRLWADDLDGMPADLLAEACRLWRNSPEKSFPTPGQLKLPVIPILKHRHRLGRRAYETGVALGMTVAPPPALRS